MTKYSFLSFICLIIITLFFSYYVGNDNNQNPAAQTDRLDPSVRLINANSLAKDINEDRNLDIVLEKAEALIKQGMNAGGYYHEVWIRDLNTFIDTALLVGGINKIEQALLTFFHFQDEDGSIIDGYVPATKAVHKYKYITSKTAPMLRGFKNTVETDQESSLVQAIYKYVTITGDKSILDTNINGLSVAGRLDNALKFLLAERYSNKYGLIWGATTADWGDVQPEHSWGVELDNKTHRAIDIYDNAMLIIAINNYSELIGVQTKKGKKWRSAEMAFRAKVREHLWDSRRTKFIPHVYIEKSPFPKTFDESNIYFFGGTAVALEAGLVSESEMITMYRDINQARQLINAQTIGLTLYPAYPQGFFKNEMMAPYSYQNGGDWTWFGGRWVQQLVAYGRPDLAYYEIKPMVERVINNEGFYEWYNLNNQPQGANNFKGSAGVLSQAIRSLKHWAANPDFSRTNHE